MRGSLGTSLGVRSTPSDPGQAALLRRPHPAQGACEEVSGAITQLAVRARSGPHSVVPDVPDQQHCCPCGLGGDVGVRQQSGMTGPPGDRCSRSWRPIGLTRGERLETQAPRTLLALVVPVPSSTRGLVA